MGSRYARSRAPVYGARQQHEPTEPSDALGGELDAALMQEALEREWLDYVNVTNVLTVQALSAQRPDQPPLPLASF